MFLLLAGSVVVLLRSWVFLFLGVDVLGCFCWVLPLLGVFLLWCFHSGCFLSWEFQWLSASVVGCFRFGCFLSCVLRSWVGVFVVGCVCCR